MPTLLLAAVNSLSLIAGATVITHIITVHVTCLLRLIHAYVGQSGSIPGVPDTKQWPLGLGFGLVFVIRLE